MSKRLIVVFVAMSVLATSNAFASRARLLVMGTGDAGGILAGSGNGGSFYYDDAYNVFYNPAYTNDFKNWGTIEKSNYPGSSAQGGFVGSFMNWNLGAYFNRVGGVTGGYDTTNNMRPLDLLIGGDMGVKFGLGFTWGSSKLDTDHSDTDLTVRAGVSIADIEPFIAFKVIGKDNVAGGATAEQKHKDMTFGARYKWGEWTPYAAYRTTKTDDTKQNTSYGLGLGRNAAIAEGARMVYALSAWRQLGHVTSVNRTVLPVDFAVEGDVLSWLTVRGGLTYALVDQSTDPALGGATSGGDATTGRVGATIHIGKADLDWALGTANPVIAQNENAGQNTIDSQVNGIGPGFFTAMGLNYRW